MTHQDGPEWELKRAEGRRIIARYARMMRHGRRPIPCTPSELEKRSPLYRRQGLGTDYKIIYDTRELAEAAAREMREVFGDEQSAHACGRSNSGHFHLTKHRPKEERTWTDYYDPRRSCTFRTHQDGRVATYDHEVQASGPNLWRATAWDKDPRRHDDATSEPLCADATWAELQAALAVWAGGA